MEVVHQHRSISLYWQEKVGLFIHFCQMHALMWIMCYNFYPAESVTPRTLAPCTHARKRADAMGSLLLLLPTR